MAFKRGANAYFAMDNAAGTLVNLSGYLNSVEFPQSINQLDVTTFGTGSVRTYIAGFIGGDKVTLGGYYDTALFAQLGSCEAAQNAGTASFSVVYGPGGSVSGEGKVACEVIITSFNPSAKIDGAAAISAELQISGAITNSSF